MELAQFQTARPDGPREPVTKRTGKIAALEAKGFDVQVGLQIENPQMKSNGASSKAVFRRKSTVSGRDIRDF